MNAQYNEVFHQCQKTFEAYLVLKLSNSDHVPGIRYSIFVSRQLMIVALQAFMSTDKIFKTFLLYIFLKLV